MHIVTLMYVTCIYNRKYKQIHTIQTNTNIIHTPILPTYIQKYIQNKSVTMCIYVYLCACICMYMPMCIYVYVLLCYYVYLCACIYMIWCASCMCMYLHVSVCINWLSLFTRGYMCAVGLHWALRVTERTRRDHLFWNFVLFFKGRQPGSPWAKPWPTCWCSTGAAWAGLATQIAHAPFVARVLAAMHDSVNGAVIPCRNERQHADTDTIPTDTCTYMHIPTFHT